MEPSSRREAQRRVERIRGFREELAELERERVVTLTDEQRARLDAHLERRLAGLAARFDLEVTEPGERISLGVRIASLLGCAAFFAALVLFLHRVWGALSQAVQVTILLAAPLLLLAAAEVVLRRGAGRYFTSLFVVAAGVAFLMEMEALGSILNVVPSPHFLLAVGLFAMLVAHAYGLRLPLVAGLLLLTAYTASLWLSAAGAYWAAFLERSETLLPAAAVVYAAPSLGRARHLRDFGSVYRACGAGSVLVAVLLLALMGQTSFLPLHDRTLETLYQVAGLALSVGLIVHGIRLGRSGLVNLGSAAFLVFLYVKLHAWWWAWMPKYLFFLLIGLIAVALLFVFRRLRTRVSGRSAA